MESRIQEFEDLICRVTCIATYRFYPVLPTVSGMHCLVQVFSSGLIGISVDPSGSSISQGGEVAPPQFTTRIELPLRCRFLHPWLEILISYVSLVFYTVLSYDMYINKVFVSGEQYLVQGDKDNTMLQIYEFCLLIIKDAFGFTILCFLE